jgi:uncharacterized protein YciI
MTKSSEEHINAYYQEPVPSAFDEFYLVLLDHGPNHEEPQTAAEREQLEQNQLAHLAFLKELYDQGLSVGAGPFSDGKGGLILLRAGDLGEEDVESMLNSDAHIRSGRLAPRIRKFVMPKGIL